MPCLVTGQLLPATATHPAIKGVLGAQSSGAALVSFNAPAYCSFERKQNFNAPVSKYAAFAYTTVLNHLLADKKHVARFGKTTVVYWAADAEPRYQDAFAYLLNGDDNTLSNEDLEDYMQAIAAGKPVNWAGIVLKPDNRFYVLGLSPNAARVSVRFFLRDSFGTMVKNLKEHYDRLQIVTDNRSKFKNIPLWVLLKETVNEKASRATTIQNKYFTSACATPAMVFPLILNLADKHLKKLEERNRIYYTTKIERLMEKISKNYPIHHTMQEQGIFQLGYYHQVQKQYQEKDHVKIHKKSL